MCETGREGVVASPGEPQVEIDVRGPNVSPEPR